MVAGVVDQDMAHGLGCGHKKGPSVRPELSAVAADQAQISLVYQSRRIECVPAPLVPEFLGCQATQLIIDGLKQLARRLSPGCIWFRRHPQTVPRMGAKSSK